MVFVFFFVEYNFYWSQSFSKDPRKIKDRWHCFVGISTTSWIIKRKEILMFNVAKDTLIDYTQGISCKEPTFE